MHTYTDTLPALTWKTPVLGSAVEHLERAGAGLWRVIDRRGTIRGHLRVVADPLGVRYRAERLRLASPVADPVAQRERRAQWLALREVPDAAVR